VDLTVARLTPLLPDPPDDDPSWLRDADIADRMAHWGFLAHPDLPDGPGPAFLLVALRPAPTLRHYDPEVVDYWIAEDGRGRRRTLTHATHMPRSESFTWGVIRLTDRLGVSNEYLTFGGRLDAVDLDDAVVAAFTSPVPLLRRGGHSQAWDPGADAVAAFFGRMLAAIAERQAFEAAFGTLDPAMRYAAFVRDFVDRLASARGRGVPDDDLASLLTREGTRLRRDEPGAWATAGDILGEAAGA
jgi:hypothetical protein